jgi:uncharacterized integral membrane protein
MTDNAVPSTSQSEVRAILDDAGSEVEGIKLSGGALAAAGGIALLVIFMAQNTQDVTLQFLFWDFTWSLWFVVLLSAAIGAFVWIGLGVLRRHRRRVARRAARRGD